MNAKIKNLLNGIFLLSVLGWLNAAYTLWHRQKIVGGVASGKSFCNFSSTFNCDAVALSKHSLMFGIPVSTFGMMFYTIMILLALWALFSNMDQKTDDVEKSSHSLFLLSSINLIPTAYLAGVSYFVLGTICIMCSITYVINVILWALCFKFFKSSKRSSIVGSFKSLPQAYWIVGILLVLVQLISHKIVNSMVSASDEDLDDKTLSMFVTRHVSSPAQNFNLSDVPFYGPADAPVTLVEFSDFQCPFCAKSAMTMPSMIADYKHKIKVVFKNYPLDPTCNSEMKSGGHPVACIAAKTGWCVYKLKGNEAFFKYKSTAFENQEGINATKLSSYAEAQGIDKAALDACVNDYATQKAITDQIAEGKAAGVQGTPSIFINGKIVEAGFIPKIFNAIMEKY